MLNVRPRVSGSGWRAGGSWVRVRGTVRPSAESTAAGGWRVRTPSSAMLPAPMADADSVVRRTASSLSMTNTWRWFRLHQPSRCLLFFARCDGMRPRDRQALATLRDSATIEALFCDAVCVRRCIGRMLPPKECGMRTAARCDGWPSSSRCFRLGCISQVAVAFGMSCIQCMF